MTLRPYQLRASSALVSNRRGVVQSPAGSGKTIIAAHAIEQFLKADFANPDRPRIVWLANTTEQCDQARNAISLFPLIAACSNITVSCYASVTSCAGASLVICDECHHIAAPEARKCLEGCTGRIWGLSATPVRADELAPDVFTLIGPIVATIARQELVDSGCIAPAIVDFHSPNLKDEYLSQVNAAAEPLIQQRIRFWRNVSEDDIRKRTIWQLIQPIGVFENQRRNQRIVELAKQHAPDSALLIVGSIEHGEYLKSLIPDSDIAHSKLGIKKRRILMGRFKARELKTLIATSLADEGLDLPCANVLILTAAGRSAAKAEQRTGRVLRAWGDKTHGHIIDFWDHQHYYLLAQSKARRRVYASLGYAINQ